MNEKVVPCLTNCGLQKADAVYFYEKYFNLVKWTPKAQILDAGCVQGSGTFWSLYGPLPECFQKITVAEISSIILTYDKEKCAVFPRVEFLELDIANVIPENLKENYDHIFCFYCLHVIDEQRYPQAMKNIFNLLKPGGSTFMSIVVTSILCDVYRNMARENKWPSNFQKIMSPFHECADPEQKLRQFLDEAGFDITLCKFEERTYTFDGWNSYYGWIASIIPFTRLTQSGRTELQDAFKAESRQSSLIKIGKRYIHIRYTVLVAFALKPDSNQSNLKYTSL